LKNEIYILIEVDGAISLLKFIAFWLIPYYSCSQKCLEITEFMDLKTLESIEKNKIEVSETVKEQ